MRHVRPFKKQCPYVLKTRSIQCPYKKMQKKQEALRGELKEGQQKEHRQIEEKLKMEQVEILKPQACRAICFGRVLCC